VNGLDGYGRLNMAGVVVDRCRRLLMIEDGLYG
jgi:hypothetical protein